jgi:hypothetical protein
MQIRGGDPAGERHGTAGGNKKGVEGFHFSNWRDESQMNGCISFH